MLRKVIKVVRADIAYAVTPDPARCSNAYGQCASLARGGNLKVSKVCFFVRLIDARLGICGQFGGPVFHGLYAEVAGLSDDYNSRA